MSSLATIDHTIPETASARSLPAEDETKGRTDLGRTLTIPLNIEPTRAREALGNLDLAGSAGKMFHALAAGDRLALAPTLLPESAAGQSIGIIWRFDGHPSDSRPGPDSFASFDEPSHLKARWDVRIEPRAATQTYLSIRTELIPTDEDARLRLLDAWGIVEPLATAFARRIARTVRGVSEDRDEEL